MFIRHRRLYLFAIIIPRVIPGEEFVRSRMNLFAEGSAVALQNLLRLYNGEPLVKSLYGDHQQHHRRALQHKDGNIDGFAKRHHINRLVYYETFTQVGNAIAREKQIKSWTRAKRIALIQGKNPTWQDLAEDWGERFELQIPRRAGLVVDSSARAG